MAFRRFCEAVVAGEPLALFGDGRQTRDFTFVSDAVAATRAAADATSAATGCAIDVGGGSRVSLKGAIDVLERQLPVQQFQAQEGDVRDTAADISRARALIENTPTVSLETGLEREWSWVQERHRPA